jgi:hypothetical protein
MGERGSEIEKEGEEQREEREGREIREIYGARGEE